MTQSGRRISRRRFYAVSAAAMWIFGPLTYLILEAVVAAAFRPHYRYAHNYISDLGVPSNNSPLAWLMNSAFCLQGVLFFAGAILICRAFEPRKAELFLMLAAANAVGNTVIAAFHSGPVAQADATAWVHVNGAVWAIAGGNAAIAAGASIFRNAGGPLWYRRVSVGLAALGLLGFVMFVVELTAPVYVLPPAVWERGSVYPIVAWQMLTAAVLCYPTGRWFRLTT
ncbi:MAG: DUF998 domain-containing protein [Mycobacterium sp.]|nr:DUF998 domain-containing protein [Mycobacterium sp.]MBV9723515.1 DUF998 domain-containing protein [Mycobacterium sp.]